MNVEAAVDLSIPDNTAFTVLRALRSLGYDALTRVERTELYRFNLADTRQTRADIADKIRHAEVIFNPNKHRLSIAGETGQSESADWEAVVTDRDDDTTRLAHLLAERFGLQGLRSLEQAIAWRLFEDGRSASKERLDWACRALLCNPHSQTSAVRARPHRTPVGNAPVAVEP